MAWKSSLRIGLGGCLERLTTGGTAKLISFMFLYFLVEAIAVMYGSVMESGSGWYIGCRFHGSTSGVAKKSKVICDLFSHRLGDESGVMSNLEPVRLRV